MIKRVVSAVTLGILGAILTLLAMFGMVAIMEMLVPTAEAATICRWVGNLWVCT